MVLEPFRLIIAGGRNITQYEHVRSGMLASGFWKKYGRRLIIVSGGAKGADSLGEDLAALGQIPIERKLADWDDIKAPGAVVKIRSDGVMYNAKAGHDRNQQMADIADGLLLVWDGKSTGSKDMLARATKKGLEIYEHIVRSGYLCWC